MTCAATIKADAAEHLAAFDAEVAFGFDYLKMAGLAVALLQDSQICWFKGYGFADLETRRAVTKDTPFHLASLTKTYASTLLLQLVERGELDLDSPVEAFGIALESKGTVTVRHLLTHTSEGEPGLTYSYNGSRFALLDQVIEGAGGQSFEATLRRDILQPLALNSTGRMSDQLPVPMARPYKRAPDGQLVAGKYKSYFGSSAGLVASVEDYARYLFALRAGELVTESSLTAAFTPHQTPSGQVLPYGLGWFVEEVGGLKTIWHYGYWESVSSLVVMLPQRDLTLLAFANTDALSRGFNLGEGKVLNSPLAVAFFDSFVGPHDSE
ncbi:serine hydrolase domain-containing protein [Rhodovibrionaceae bacterium A322]